MKKYSKYKPSNIEWIGDIPEHWEVRKLKYCLKDKITDGPHETPEFIKEGIPFLSVDGIQNGELVFEGCRYISTKAHELYIKKCKVCKDDILMGKSASIGKIARVKVDFDFSIWSPLALIKVKKEIISPIYIEYFLKSPIAQYQMEILATSNTQKNISMEQIPNILLVFPPLPEQNIITSYLDRKTSRIDILTEKKQKLVELLKEQREAIINNAVTKGIKQNVKMKSSGIEWIGDIPEHWEVRKLKWIVALINEKSIDSKSEFVIGVENIESKTGKIIINTINNYEGDLRVFAKNDILFNKLRPYLHKVYFAEKKGVCIGELLIFRAKPSVLPKFLYYHTTSIDFINEVNSSTYGTKMPRASWEDFISHLYISLPSLSEQQQIVDFIEKNVNEIDSTILKIEREIELLKEYKQALISEAVTGKIDVRGED